MNETDGFVKVLADPAFGTVLGCHIIGHHVSMQIYELVVAMKSGADTVGDVRDAIQIYPALNEVVHRAFSGQFHAHE